MGKFFDDLLDSPTFWTVLLIINLFTLSVTDNVASILLALFASAFSILNLWAKATLYDEIREIIDEEAEKVKEK